MTAIFAFTQPAAAYLITDGALYDPNGIVVSLCSKTLIAEWMRLAIAPSGRCTSVDLGRELTALGATTDQAALMAAMPLALERIRAQNVHFGTPEADMQVHVALWSDRADQPQIWMMATNRPPSWGPYQPKTWISVAHMIGCDAAPTDILGRSVDLSNPADFDPADDGGTLIDHYRRTPWPDGRFYVGGRAELVTVTRDGVEQRNIREWPDRVGSLIRPDAPYRTG